MLTYSSRLELEDRERKTKVFRVQSKHTFYNVATGEELISVFGVGIEEEYNREDLPQSLSDESLAIFVIMQLESTL